ncbi:protein kinase domain-containing protein [Archangium sp.]|uniref:serine/threonine-protein kinase n=1 Tax=Archangium sp. TaxID=1872627 RepID=UPI00286D320B|nr:protein kinase [Archangium sp.]
MSKPPPAPEVPVRPAGPEAPEPAEAWDVAGEDFGPPPLLLPPPPVPETPEEPSEARGASGYQVLRLLGEGGMAQVFHARRLGAAGFAREVALKRIRSRPRRDDSFRRMFVDEALLAARLRHPGIAQVYDLIEEPEGYALVMEYVEGHTLKELMQVAARKAKPLEQAFACHIAVDVAEALHYAHQRTEEGRPLGIVHRDVSPHNVMVSTTGEVKLLDFGIAWSRLEGRDETASGIVKGKTSYMSPEQALGEEDIDSRSDQFSLAILLVELLTGQRVFDAGANELKTLHRIILASPEDVSAATRALPEALRPLIGRALSRDREARFPSCADFAHALREYLASQRRVFGPRQVTQEVARLLSLPEASAEATVSMSPASAPGRTAAPRPSLPRRALLAVLLLALGAAGLLAVRRQDMRGPSIVSRPQPEEPRAAEPQREPSPAVDEPVTSPSPPPLPARRRSGAPTPTVPTQKPPTPRRSLATPMGTSFADAPSMPDDSSGNTTPQPETP